MAIAKLNFGSVDVGRVDLPQNDLAKSLMQYGTQLNETQRQRALDAQRIAESQSNMMMNQARFGREQELNKRQDLEYNRELGLRDMRKNLAAEYEANPYADIWGGGAANKMLDKQVLDYVDSGKEITPEIATKLQGLYETNRPFKEDLSQVFRSKLLAAGEDPTKADAYAKSMTDSMPFSRATQQAQLDKQQEIQQGYYNAVAAANKDVAKMGFDIAKANQEASIDKAKLDLDYKKLLYGNTGGSGSGGTTADGDKITAGGIGGISQILKSVGPSDAKEGNQDVEAWHNKGYSYQQIYSAMKDAVDTDPTALVLSDNTLNTKAVNERLAMLTPGANQFTNTSKVSDITTNVGAKDLLAQFAPRQIAGYNPEGMLERAKTAVPELFAGGATSEVPTTANTGYENTVKKIESSGGKYDAVNKGSGAMGAYQFLPSTLDDYRKRNGNFTNEEFAKNPELQDKVFGQFTLDNENKLRNRGIEVNDYTKWIAHNLGAGNVKDFVEGRETPRLLSAISAQFGGKPSGIKEYNDRFGEYFTGERKADTNKDTKDLVAAFDAKTPVTTGTDVNTRYDALQSMIEPTLGAKTELTLGKKEELINKYEPVIDKVRSDYLDNNGGPWDSNKATINIMHSLGISRPKAENLYETITKDLKSNSVMSDAIAESNRTGVPISETDAYLKTSPSKLFSKVNNDRLAEIERTLGDNPAPTVENQLLINERANILRRNMSAGSTVKGMKDDLIKDIVNTTGIGSGIPTR